MSKARPDIVCIFVFYTLRLQAGFAQMTGRGYSPFLDSARRDSGDSESETRTFYTAKGLTRCLFRSFDGGAGKSRGNSEELMTLRNAFRRVEGQKLSAVNSGLARVGSGSRGEVRCFNLR